MNTQNKKNIVHNWIWRSKTIGFVIALVSSFSIYSQSADGKPKIITIQTSNKVFHCEIDEKKGILIKNKSKIIQTIPVGEEVQSLDPENIVQVEDFNFDGSQDISVATMATTRNIFVDVYLFDPTKDRFIKNSVLSEIPSPSFDPKLKQLSTYNNDGVAGLTYTANTFQIEKNKPVLVKTEVQSLADNDTDYSNFVRTVEKQANGKKTVVCKLRLKQIGDSGKMKITKIEIGSCKNCKSEDEVCPKK
jgi:hypothetical protein